MFKNVNINKGVKCLIKLWTQTELKMDEVR